jgi:hypothetical protein
MSALPREKACKAWTYSLGFDPRRDHSVLVGEWAAMPKWFTQRRTVSWYTKIPRSTSKSSTSRKLKVNQTDSQIAWLIISGGKR